MTNTKQICIVILLAITIDCIYGFIKPQFFLAFINALTVTSYIVLLLGVLRWGYKQGDNALRSYDRYSNTPFMNHYKSVQEKRKDANNPFLTSGIALWILHILLTIVYLNQ